MTPQELEDIRNRISALENKVAVRVTVSDLISQLSDFRQTVDMFESRLASLEAKQVDVIAEEANRICDDACASSSVDSRFLLLSQVASLSADLAIAVAAGAKEPGLDEVMDELSELQERLEHEIPTDPAITSRRTALDDDEDDLIEDTDDEVAMDQRQAG